MCCVFCARVCGTPDRVCVLKAAREEKRRTVTHASEMAPSTHTYATLTQTLVLSALTAALVRLLLRARHKVQGDEPLLVLSFGTLCLTARSLGVAGCRTFAAPFDWIFSNPAIVAHVIANDGRALLDPSEYIKAPTGGICHRTYSGMLKVGMNKQNRHSIIFNHHDPLERADDLAYWARRRAAPRSLSSPLPKLCAICLSRSACRSPMLILKCCSMPSHGTQTRGAACSSGRYRRRRRPTRRPRTRVWTRQCVIPSARVDT